MKSLKGTKTEKHLLAAFAGESQARNRYTYAASVARKEGYIQIAELFTETADNEREHAKRFFKFLEGGMVEITAIDSGSAGPSGVRRIRTDTTSRDVAISVCDSHESGIGRESPIS